MTANHNCLTCKTAKALPDDIQGALTLGTVANFNTDYSVTINDRNGNNLYQTDIASGPAGEMVITFAASDAGIFHHYASFPLTARNLTTGEIDTITDGNGTTADCIEIVFRACDDTAAPYEIVLFVEKTCNCETGCNCV